MSGFLLDSYPAGSTIYALFHTFNSSGASVIISDFVATDIEIYKNGSTTQRASDNGYALLDTDGINFDGTTGIHGISIDLSDNTDAGFYTVGSQFTVVIGPITADTQTVNFVLGTFRIAAAENTTGYPTVTIKDGTGTGELDTSSGVVLAKDHTGANLATATALDDVDNLLDTEIAALTTAVADLPTNAELATALSTADDAVLAAVATVDTVVDAIKVKTDSLTFTESGVVDANVQFVNDVEVSGTGAPGDEWGP